MKLKKTKYLFLLLLGLSLATSQAAIYTHTFNEGTGTLTGTPVDSGGVNWSTSLTTSAPTGLPSINANGVSANSGSAVLPYAFGSGQFEVTTSFTRNTTTGNSIAGIYFTTSTPLTAGYVNLNEAEAYGTFALRTDGTFELWGGVGTGSNNDGNSINSYNASLANTETDGQLRLILDTSATNWTLNGFYTPSGKAEFQVDLNGAGAGKTFTYGTNPGAFTGVGLMYSSNATTFQNFSLTSVPEPSALTLLGCGLGALLLRKRR